MKTYTRAQMEKMADIQAAYATSTIAANGIQKFLEESGFDEYNIPDNVFDDLNVVLDRLAKVQTVLRQDAYQLLDEEVNKNE